MSYMKSNRDVMISTASGHCIVFKEGEPTYVPDDERIKKVCVERGCVKCDPPVTAEDTKTVTEQKINPALQKARAKANPPKPPTKSTSAAKTSRSKTTAST